MDIPRSHKPRFSVATPWLWLGFAAVFWLFAGGRYVVGVAAWLAPVFMLRWLRGQRVAVGLPLAVLATAAANSFAWRGITDVIMSVYQYVAFAVAAAVVYLTPYFAAEDPVVVAHLPTRGVWAVYPRAGDVFAWLVVAVFAVFAVRALLQKRKIPVKNKDIYCSA